MLRILVISLFVANLLLLGFQGSQPAPPPEPAVVTTVVEDDGIPTIHLFSEMMENRDLMAGNRQCFSLGPFHSSEDRDETRNRLTELTINISERQTQALVEKGYWVYMPPYDSLLEANRALLSLQALGLKDIGIIYDGEWQNAISLGYFLRQKNALRRKKDLEDRGHSPMIRVQRQAEPRYWLEYEQVIGSDLVALDFSNRPNDFMQRALPCPEESGFPIVAVDPAPLVENLVQAQMGDVDIEAESSENGVADQEANVESLPEDDGTTEPVETVDAVPADTDEQEPGDVDGTESGQGAEIEDGSGTETGTGSGEASV